MVWGAAKSRRAKSGSAAARGPFVQAWFDMKVGGYREPKDSSAACHEVSWLQPPLLIQNLPPGSPGKDCQVCLAVFIRKKNSFGGNILSSSQEHTPLSIASEETWWARLNGLRLDPPPFEGWLPQMEQITLFRGHHGDHIWVSTGLDT